MVKVRRVGRERAFQALFGCNFHKDPAVEIAKDIYFHFFIKRSKAVDRFALELIEGVFLHKDKLDQIISSAAKNWKLHRIAKVEITILRLAVYEMLYRTDVPVKVAINEGIELSKKYGDIKSHKFVNGVLDAVAKSHTKST